MVCRPQAESNTHQIVATVLCRFRPLFPEGELAVSGCQNRNDQGVTNGVFQAVFFRVVCSEGGPDPQSAEGTKMLENTSVFGNLCPSENVYLCCKLRLRI